MLALQKNKQQKTIIKIFISNEAQKIILKVSLEIIDTYKKKSLEAIFIQKKRILVFPKRNKKSF